MQMEFDEILATVLVDSVGVVKAMDILSRATDQYQKMFPGSHRLPDYVRVIGFVKQQEDKKKSNRN